MIRTAFVVMVFALTGLPAIAKPNEGPVVKPTDDPWTKTQSAVKRDPLKRPLLWSITKNGKTTYALGTMHVGVDAEARLPQIVWDKIDAAPAFAMETDTTDPVILGMGQRKAGTLHDDLGPAYWKKLEALIEPAVLRGLDKLSPAIAAAMLSVRGLPITPPMDGILLARASRLGKRIVYLEPAAKQAALLEKWMDIRTLKVILDAPDSGLKTTKEMLAAYVAGDESKLLALADSQKQQQLDHGFTEAEYQQSMEDMLYARNASWIAGIEAMHAGGGGFIAVGALHLVGKRSVLDLLAAKGYKVLRVTQ